MLQQLTDELDAIDTRAYEMARAVLDDAGQQHALASEQQQLMARLDQLALELAQDHPVEHTARRRQLSETTADLDYVRRRRFMSLRLGRVWKRQSRP